MKNLTNLLSNLKPVLMLCLILGFMSVPAISQQTNDIHIVQQGESLFSIAREYGITVGDLRSWNNLESDNLQPGQTIRIAPPIAENQISHTVAQGETLFSISRQYGVTIAEIQQWNDLRSNNLDLGTELTIFLPEDESQGQELETPLLPEERESIVRSADSSPANTYYTVRSGDTLFKIAGDHGMTIGELRSLNNLEGDLLRIGQQLIREGDGVFSTIGRRECRRVNAPGEICTISCTERRRQFRPVAAISDEHAGADFPQSGSKPR